MKKLPVPLWMRLNSSSLLEVILLHKTMGQLLKNQILQQMKVRQPIVVKLLKWYLCTLSILMVTGSGVIISRN